MNIAGGCISGAAIRRGVAALLCAALALAAAAPAAQTAGSAECRAPGGAASEPYRWYPSLDLARIPFHVGAGAWGPRAAIAAPEAPATTRTVGVNSAAQLTAAAMVPGTRITVEADFIGHAMLAGDVSDVDIVVPKGRRIAQLTIGRYTPPSSTRRVRIRGSTPGQHSGGVVGSIVFLSAAAADVIIDGVDLNGEDGKGGNLLWHFAGRVQRAAVVNVRGHSAGPIAVQRGTDIVIAGSRFMSGARTREENGYPEGWGIRGGDRLVVYDNRIEGTRYHRVRVHPEPGPPQYAWLADNVFVDRHEARIFSAFNTVGTPFRYAAVWAVCNRVYAHSTCLLPSFDGQHANYARLTSNALFGAFSETLQRALQQQHGLGHDYLSGNRFSAWREPPAWDGPGDATAVPLPQVRPERYNHRLAFKPCPAP
jgi:hypothetical protein